VEFGPVVSLQQYSPRLCQKNIPWNYIKQRRRGEEMLLEQLRNINSQSCQTTSGFTPTIYLLYLDGGQETSTSDGRSGNTHLISINGKRQAITSSPV